jgi:glucosylceramidase
LTPAHPLGIQRQANRKMFARNTTATAADQQAAHSTEQALQNDCVIIDKDPSKIVCVCNERTCRDLSYEWPTVSGRVDLVTTARSGLRFRAERLADATVATNDCCNGDHQSSRHGGLSVDIGVEHQEVLGWGGAFTDAATINIKSLSDELGERLLASYFGPNGLQYSFGRVPIGGSDFSTRAYSYDDSHQPDLNLTHWALADEDLNYKIPIVRRAIKLTETLNGAKLKLFASPWSPPKWMKTSKDFKRGHLIQKDEIYQSYANYLIKFYQAYRDHGIEFWGATVQNEPLAAYLPFYFFNSLQMSSSETIKFIADHYGPALEAFGYTKENFKLMIGDDSLGFVNQQVPTVMNNERAHKYIAGLAFHWYTSNVVVPYSSLTKLVNSLRGKIEFVMMSEACQGAFLSFKHVDLGDWERGQSYASDIIEDFRRQTGAWIDWNLALDLEGGPNWAKNYVDSPIIVDKTKNEFYKQPMYYVLAHFSRFMRPGSVVVSSTIEKVDGVSVIAAYLKGTSHLVVNLLNTSHNQKQFPVTLRNAAKVLYLIDKIVLEPKSVSTIVIKL